MCEAGWGVRQIFMQLEGVVTFNFNIPVGGGSCLQKFYSGQRQDNAETNGFGEKKKPKTVLEYNWLELVDSGNLENYPYQK